MIIYMAFLMMLSFYIYFKSPNFKFYKNEQLSYSPEVCTITNYKFTFIYDTKEQRFKVHGVWPDGCKECESCSYPSCCNLENVMYTDPQDPNNFIGLNWFQTMTSDGCGVFENKVSLFEHEYYKHISCTTLKSTTEFLNLTQSLYMQYYDKYVIGFCKGYDEIWLSLDANFEYKGFECH